MFPLSHGRDVSQLELGDYPRPVQSLICKAHKIGWLMQVNTDGYTPNKRLNLAMGLASIHIAQLYEVSILHVTFLLSKSTYSIHIFYRLEFLIELYARYSLCSRERNIKCSLLLH